MQEKPAAILCECPKIHTAMRTHNRVIKNIFLKAQPGGFLGVIVFFGRGWFFAFCIKAKLDRSWDFYRFSVGCLFSTARNILILANMKV